MDELSESNFVLEGHRSRVCFAAGGVAVTNERAPRKLRNARFQLSDLVGVSYRPPKSTSYGWLHFFVCDGTTPPKGSARALRDPYAIVLPHTGAAPAVLRLLAGFFAHNPTPERHGFEATNRYRLPAFAWSAASTDAHSAAPSDGLALPPSKRASSQGAGLPAKAQRLYDAHIADPAIRLVIVGMGGQAVVALDDRCVVLKPGWLASSTGGGRVTTFDYRDVTSVQMHTHISTGVLEILTPSHSGSQEHDYWTTRRDRQPLKLPNCIPIAKRDLGAIAPQVEALRRLVSLSKRPAEPARTEHLNRPALADQLRNLAELHQAGSLSDEEFAQAKAALLGGGAE